MNSNTNDYYEINGPYRYIYPGTNIHGESFLRRVDLEESEINYLHDDYPIENHEYKLR